MYGFKPRHAQGEPVQNLADGGIVNSLTGMLGMRKRTPEEMLAADAKVQERNREAAARVAARAKPAQPAVPAEEKAVSGYAGMSALQRREKELGLKDGGSVGGFKPGGLIRGPGTGTSDSIKTEKRPGTFIMPADSTQAIGPEALERLGEPEEMEVDDEREMDDDAEREMDDDAEEGEESVPVRLSNGEFELPPEQVQALGEAVLTVLRDATHTPTGSGNPTSKGFAPNQFFANGGTVFGSRGLAGLREVIPKVQAMGYPQTQQAPQAPAGSRDLAALKAMIPKMEAMGYPQALADGGMVENEVTRVGNSYSGGNVGGSVSINGQAGAGTMSTVPAPVSTAAPAPAAATAATAPAPSTAAPPTPAAAPMGWAERNAQRSNQVTASSIMDSPERRAAQAALAPAPAVAPAPAIGLDATKPKPFGVQPPAFGTPSGFQPRGYANGGTVQDEEKQRLANQTSMYVQGAQAAAANRPPAPTAPPPAAPPPEPQAAFGVFPQMGRNTAGGRPAPAPVVPPPATEVEGWRTKAVMDGAAQDAQASWDRGGVDGVAGAAGAVARGAITAIPTAIGEFAYNTVAPLGGVARGFWNGITGGDSAPEAPATTPAPTGATTTAGAGRGAINHTPVNPTQPATAAPAPTNAPTNAPAAPTQQPTNEVMPGVYRHGRGQYSDNAAGMAMPPGFTGQPNAQNMAAADALVARNTPAGFQPAGSPQASVQAPIVRNSTNDWAARKALENAATAASSITANGGRFDQNGRAGSPQAAAYRAALANDFALQQAQPGMDQAAMRENAGIQREGMQQDGATARTGMQEQGANARDAGRMALARDEFGLRKDAAGFQTRAATRLEGLQTRYEAETDPAKRADLAKQLREIQGKEQPARYKVAAGGQQIDANGVAYKVPDRVFNEQTGQFSDGTGAAPAPQAARPVGATSTVNGKTAVWDGSKWVPR